MFLQPEPAIPQHVQVLQLQLIRYPYLQPLQQELVQSAMVVALHLELLAEALVQEVFGIGIQDHVVEFL